LKKDHGINQEEHAHETSNNQGIFPCCRKKLI
jgi:hypothetical protein